MKLSVIVVYPKKLSKIVFVLPSVAGKLVIRGIEVGLFQV
jgi:hypothetical protein